MLACSRKAKFVNYTAGDVVYSIGDKPKAFYLVAHGELNLVVTQPCGQWAKLLSGQRWCRREATEFGLQM